MWFKFEVWVSSWNLELKLEVKVLSSKLKLVEVKVWSWGLSFEVSRLKVEIETWGWALILKHTVKDCSFCCI